MSAMVALAVVCNIMMVLYHMFFGDIPEEERFLNKPVPTCIRKCRPSNHGFTRVSPEE